MSEQTAAEVASAASEYEFVVEQVVRHAARNGVLVESVILLVSLVGSGEDAVAACFQVSDAMGLPKPQRLH